MGAVIKASLAFALAVLILVYLLPQLNLTLLKNLFVESDVSLLFLSGFFYLLTIPLRAFRFLLILPQKKITFWQMTGISAVHAFFLSLLPARLGELSYVRMIHSRGICLSRNVGSLVVARIIDILVIFFLFFLFSWETLLSHGFLTLGFSALCILGLIVALFTPGKILSLLVSMAAYIPHKKIRDKILSFLNKIQENITGISPQMFLSLFFLGLCIWGSAFVFNYVFLLAIDIHVNPLVALGIFTVILFLSMLPIYPPGGFGAIEGTWSAGLIAAGIFTETAIAAAFAIHGFQLLLIVLATILCLPLLQKNPHTESEKPAKS